MTDSCPPAVHYRLRAHYRRLLRTSKGVLTLNGRVYVIVPPCSWGQETPSIPVPRTVAEDLIETLDETAPGEWGFDGAVSAVPERPKKGARPDHDVLTQDEQKRLLGLVARQEGSRTARLDATASIVGVGRETLRRALLGGRVTTETARTLGHYFDSLRRAA